MLLLELVITAKVKLYPDFVQTAQLIETLKAVKAGLNHASRVAYDNGFITSFKKLQKMTYSDLRQQYGLKSQMACNVCSVVAGSYASMKSNGEKTLAVYKTPKFQYSYGRDYSFTKNGMLSIGTLDKRIKLPFEIKGMKQYFDGSWNFGTATLIYKKDKFFLHIAVKKETPILEDNSVRNIVGIDFGMNFLAVSYDSAGKTNFFEGRHIKDKRAKFTKTRKSLQQTKTASSRRRLKKLGNRENRWMTDINHKVSKALVSGSIEGTLFVIEDLTGIRSQTEKVQRKDRYYSVSWAFYQLRQMLEYKALRSGSKVVVVDPKYTSQTCPKCGHTEKANRNKNTHTFTCKTCAYTSNDDRIGAMNLQRKGIEYIAEVMLSV